MQWSIERRTSLGFSLVLILVLSVGIGGYQITQQFIESNQLVAHTFEVLGELTETISLVANAETGHRGYVITGDESYLEPYNDTLNEIEAHLENLRTLTADNPHHQQALTQLLPLLTDRLNIFSDIIELRRASGFEAAQQAVIEGRGNQLTDEIRTLIEGMIDEENRLLEQRALASGSSSQNTLFTFAFLTAFIIALLAFVYYQINRSIATRQRTEARLKGLLEAAPDAMVIVNRDGKIVLVNAQTQKIFGYNVDELMGKSVDLLVPKRFKQHFTYRADYFNNPRAREMGVGMELYAVRKDGTEFPVEVSLSPLETDEGVLVSSAIRDISERKRKDIEVAYQASLLANVNDAIVATDANHIVTFWNRAAEEIYGWSADEIIGKQTKNILHSEITDTQQTEILQQLSDVGRYRLELVQHRKDGTPLHIERTSMSLRDQHGHITGYISVNRDVSERKRIEQENRDREHLLRVLVDNLPETIFVKDTESRFLLGNAAIATLLGVNAETDIVGKSDFDFHAHADAEIYRADELEIMRTGQAKINYEEMVFDHRHNEKRYLNTTKLPLRDENGKLIGIVGINYDITERKQFEQALRLSEQRWHSVVDSVPDVITIYDRDGVITFTNRVPPTMSIADVIGKSMYDFALPGYREVMERAVQTVLDTGESTTYEITFAKSPRNYIVRLGPIMLDGKITGFISSAADITPLRQREAQIAYQANLLANVNDAIIATDSERKITYWNRTAEEIYGWSAEEAVGSLTSTIMRSEITDAQREYIIGKVAEEGHYTVEVRQHRRDGTAIDIEGTSMPLFNDEGKLTGYVSVNRDITERKRTQEEINTLNSVLEQRVIERTAQLAFLAEASRVLSESFDYSTQLKQLAELTVKQIADWCAIDMLEQDGTLQRLEVAHSDPQKLEMLREVLRNAHPNPEAAGGVYEVLHTGQSKLYPEMPLEAIEAGALNEQARTAARSLGMNSLMLVPLLSGGQALGVITLVMSESGRHYSDSDLALAEDLARRAALLIDNARLYEESQRMNEELEQRVSERTLQLEVTNKELEAFSYSVSHDLRAPLRSIDGFSQALLEDYGEQLDTEGQSYLTRVRAASQRMATLIDDLINLSRMTRAEMKTEEVTLSDIARSIAVELQQEAPDRDVEFVITDGLVARGDKQLLRIALDNLLGNAWKFTSKRPHARIEFGALKQENGKTAYFVRDNGDGFDMAHANKLFGAFQRLHAMTEFEGTGIGLATVKRVIHRHGGQVWAEGSVGQGAAFYFEL